ncbi:hypothetical protein HK098_006895 [Nowakowskiella sp. JEL0407]|nr:hypothetical protein HK098_006895 [Nowakowskiella sp. JEL0407]
MSRFTVSSTSNYDLPHQVRDLTQAQFDRFQGRFNAVYRDSLKDKWLRFEHPLIVLSESAPSSAFIDPADIWEMEGSHEKYLPPPVRTRVKTRGLPGANAVLTNELIELDIPVDTYSQRPYYLLHSGQRETLSILFNRKKGKLK